MSSEAKQLRAGENVVPARGECSVLVHGVSDRRLIPLGSDDRPVADLRTLAAQDVVDPTAAPASAVRLVIAGIGIGGSVAVSVLDSAGQRFEFTAAPPAGSGVALLIEFYRRPDGTWKLRALGEGLPDPVALQRMYSIPPDAVYSSLPTAPDTVPQSADSVTPAPPSHRDWARTAAGIWEDASRSASTFAEAARYAGLNRDAELERLMGDPSARSADDPRRRQIEARHDEILDRAGRRRFAELDALVAELAEVEQSVPAPLARWTSAAWSRLPEAETATVRTGEITRPDSTSLRIPMVRARSTAGGYLVMPWQDGDDGAARSLVRRMLAAGPPGRGLWVLSDDPAVRQRWATAGSSDTGRGIEQMLADLAHRIDLADMAAEAGAMLPAEAVLPSVTVMVLDGSWVPAGDVAEAVGWLRRAAILGPRYGMSMLFLAPDDLRNSFGDGVPGSLLPLVPAQIDDPWVGLTWNFVPDDGTPADEVAFAIELRAQRGS